MLAGCPLSFRRETMVKLEKKISVNLSDELAAWLEKKAANGYKKGSLARHLLERQMQFEQQSAAKAVA